MKSLRKKITIATMLLCGAFFANVGVESNNFDVAFAEGTESVFKVQSAALRIPDDTYGEGIRFTIVMDAETYQNENVANLSTGVLLIPNYALGTDELVVGLDNSAMVQVENLSWVADEGFMKMYVHLYNIPATEYATNIAIRAYVDDGDEATTPFYTDVAVSSVAKVADWLYDNDNLTDEEMSALQGNYLTYDVFFHDGDEVTEEKGVYGEKISAPEMPAKDGYTFGGWWNKAQTVEWDFDKTTIGGVTTNLYSKWNIVTYSAKIVRADGTEETVLFTIENRADVLADIQLTANNVYYTYSWSTPLPNELALNNEQVFTETRKENIVYTVNYYATDLNGDVVLLKDAVLNVENIGDQSNIDFSDITIKSNNMNYVYSALDANQVEITRNGQVVDVNYKFVKIVDSFEGLTAGAADKDRFGKLEGGNIYYEAGGAFQTAEVVGTFGMDGTKSVNYYIYNSASVTLKATMSAEQLSQVNTYDTIKLSFYWIRNGGSDTAEITPYIGSSSGSQLTFSTPEHATWGTLTISGKDKIEEFIASGGAIAFKVDLTGGWHYVYVYVDSFEVEKGEPAATYNVNYYAMDENGNYTVLLKNEMLVADQLGEKTNIDFSDITTTVNGIKYVYAAEDARQVEIVEDGQVVDVNYKLVKVVDSFEGLTAGAADKGRFGKLEGGNIYYEAGGVFQTAEVVGTFGKDGTKSVRYYIYNSASVTLKATMSAEQLSQVDAYDTIKLSFYWIRNGGSDTAAITPYIGTASGSQLAFTTPEHGAWGTLTISGKDKIEEFIASGGAIAFKVDLTGGWHYVYVYVDSFEVEKKEVMSVTHGFESDSVTNDAYVEHASFSGTGYLKNGGENTPYSGAYLKNIEIATDNVHSGNQAIKIVNDSAAGGWGKLQIDLTEEQVAVLKEGAVITLWYKATTASAATTVQATFDFKVNGVELDKIKCFSSNYGSAYTDSIQWKQISIEVTAEMLESYGDKIVIQLSNGSVSYTDGDLAAGKTYNLWIDDITITYAN